MDKTKRSPAKARDKTHFWNWDNDEASAPFTSTAQLRTKAGGTMMSPHECSRTN